LRRVRDGQPFAGDERVDESSDHRFGGSDRLVHGGPGESAGNRLGDSDGGPDHEAGTDDEDERPETWAHSGGEERTLHGQDMSFVQALLRLLRRDATRWVPLQVPISRSGARSERTSRVW